jgi:hypothetical protein
MPDLFLYLFITLYLILTYLKHRPMGNLSPRMDLSTMRSVALQIPLSMLSPPYNPLHIIIHMFLLFPALEGQVYHHHPWTLTINYLAKITSLTDCWVCPKNLWAPDDLTYRTLPLAIETLLYNVTPKPHSLSQKWQRRTPSLMFGQASSLLGYHALCFESVGAGGLFLGTVNS